MREADDCAERAIVFYVRGISGYLPVEDRRAGVAECARIAEHLGDDELVGKALLARAFLEEKSGVVDFGVLEEALGHGKRTRDAFLTAITYANLQLAKVDQLRFDLLPDAYAEGLAYCLDHEQHAFGLYMRGSRGMELVRRGANDEAIDLALACLQETISPRIKVEVMIGLVRAGFRLGRPEARDWLEEAWQLGLSTDETTPLVKVATCAAEGSWLTADPALVDDRVHEAYRRGLVDDPWVHGDLTAWLRRLGHEVDVGRDLPRPFSFEVAGDHGAAAAAWRDLGCPFETAVALTWQGDVAARQDAVEIFASLGCRPAVAIVRRHLTANGVHVPAPRGPRPATVAHPAGLTAREAEVLRLMADGYSDKRISQALFISPKTVSVHVSHVLAKFGVTSRGEASALAHQRGLFADGVGE
jgi:DNA-binding CsgD family transcriptional regulator